MRAAISTLSKREEREAESRLLISQPPTNRKVRRSGIRGQLKRILPIQNRKGGDQDVHPLPWNRQEGDKGERRHDLISIAL